MTLTAARSRFFPEKIFVVTVVNEIQELTGKAKPKMVTVVATLAVDALRQSQKPESQACLLVC